MFTNYVRRVIETYQLKKEKGELSLNLTEPTPSRLKSECMIVYLERFTEKDNKTLRLFFQTTDDTTDYSSSIRNIDTDKFKPLCNFLKGRTSDTDAKNIELLSWLIDFDPRPYDYRNKYDSLPGFNEKAHENDKYIKQREHGYDSEVDPLIESIELKDEKNESIEDEEIKFNNEPETKPSDQEDGFDDRSSENSENSENSEDPPKSNESQMADNELNVLGGEIKEDVERKNLEEAEQPPPASSKLKNILITSGVAVSILFGGYFFLNEKSDVKSIKQKDKKDSSAIQGKIKITPENTSLSRPPMESENTTDKGKSITKIADVPEAKCMYWNEDHYQKVFCNDENITGKPIPLDKELLENFRKITFPDTITLKSEGKIWYSKSDGKFEYFTRPGKHPANNKPLRKISDYIIKTHILKN